MDPLYKSVSRFIHVSFQLDSSIVAVGDAADYTAARGASAEKAGGAGAEEVSRECSICQEVYEDRTRIARLKCSHEFHKKCVQRWLYANDSCPLCRADVIKYNY